MRLISKTLLTIALLLNVVPAYAHFVFITKTPAAEKNVHLNFGESSEPEGQGILKFISGIEVSHRSADGVITKLPLTQGDATLVSTVASKANGDIWTKHTYGVMERGGSKFLLVYFAKAYASGNPSNWLATKLSESTPLELHASKSKNEITFLATSNGKPLTDAAINVHHADGSITDGKTDKDGQYKISASESGVYAARVKMAERKSGTHGDDKYEEVRNYATLTVAVADTKKTKKKTASKMTYPDLPFGVTSFGAAVSGDDLYVCGGHVGTAHDYYKKAQSTKFLRLNLKNPKEWETVSEIPGRSGLAMVAHQGNLYRIGGFEAKNTEGEESDMYSSKDFYSFNTNTGKWSQLTDLPEGRSSHDVVVVDNKIYVIGGWMMSGKDSESEWHDTMLVADLSQNPIQWKEIDAPFRRRAISAAELNGQVVVIGGMQEKDGITSGAMFFNPKTSEWSEGPELGGEGRMNGFGTSAFLCDGKICVSNITGKLHTLSAKDQQWEIQGELKNPRIFHRLVRYKKSLIAVGGVSMETGKTLEVERIEISK